MVEILYKHKKRGTTYRILFESKMQSSLPYIDNVSVIVYQDINDLSKIWVRANSEFFDDRFEKVMTG